MFLKAKGSCLRQFLFELHKVSFAQILRDCLIGVTIKGFNALMKRVLVLGANL